MGTLDDLFKNPKNEEQLIRQSQARTKDQYRFGVKRLRGAYNGLQNTLGQIGSDYADTAGGISRNFGGNLGGFADSFGLGTAPNPANAAYGAIGAGTMGILSADAAGVNDYNASARTQAGVDKVGGIRDFLDQRQSSLDALAQQRLDAQTQSAQDAALRALYASQAQDLLNKVKGSGKPAATPQGKQPKATTPQESVKDLTGTVQSSVDGVIHGLLSSLSGITNPKDKLPPNNTATGKLTTFVDPGGTKWTYNPKTNRWMEPSGRWTDNQTFQDHVRLWSQYGAGS